MTDISKTGSDDNRRSLSLLAMILHDPVALASSILLLLLLLSALFGHLLLEQAATGINLRARNLPPAMSENLLLVFGTDPLGRSILARIIVGSTNTLMVAGGAVVVAFLVGTTLGIIAGYRGGWVSGIIMRFADIVMSFPSLLLALIVLYALGPSITNVILVLAITRVPLYLRTSRAEVLEIRERMYVMGSRLMGSSTPRLLVKHVAPATIPTLMTIATIDYAGVMLSESALSFLGLGIQPPEISWGLMVSEGQAYLTTAWWISFWPGLFIALTALSLNLLAAFFRTLGDPQQRWRIENRVRRRTTRKA